jgi:hypothetical protein
LQSQSGRSDQDRTGCNSRMLYRYASLKLELIRNREVNRDQVRQSFVWGDDPQTLHVDERTLEGHSGLLKIRACHFDDSLVE